MLLLAGPGIAKGEYPALVIIYLGRASSGSCFPLKFLSIISLSPSSDPISNREKNIGGMRTSSGRREAACEDEDGQAFAKRPALQAFLQAAFCL